MKLLEMVKDKKISSILSPPLPLPPKKIYGGIFSLKTHGGGSVLHGV